MSSPRPAPSALLLNGALVFYFHFALLLSFTHAERYFSLEGVIPFGPTKVFPLLAVPLFFMVTAHLLATDRLFERTLTLARANLAIVLPALALTASALLAAMWPGAYWKGGLSYILLVPFDCGVLLLAMYLGLCPPLARQLRTLGVLTVLLLLVTIAVDFVIPAFFSRIPSRPAGLAREPNTASFLIVLGASLGLSYERIERRDLVLLAATALAVTATLSRSGLVLFGGLVVLYWWLVSARAPRRSFALRLVPVALAGGVCLLGMKLPAMLESGEFGVFALEAAQARLELLGNEEGYAVGGDERFKIAAPFWREILDRPFFGRGTGFSYSLPQGPHVRYLQEWANSGLLALLAYIGLLAGAAYTFIRRRDGRGLATTLVIVAGSFVSHGILEQRPVPLALGLLAAAGVTLRPQEAAAEPAPLPSA